jgi:hypothetical protein
MGKKKAKLAQQLALKENAWRENVAQAHITIATESKRNNDILDHDSQSLKIIAQNGAQAAQLAIMNQKLDDLDDDQKEYFQLKRNEILTSLRSSNTSSNQTQD